MFESRDEIRQIYLNVWQKMQSQALLEPMEAIIADVIQLHTEYHPLLNTGEAAAEKDYSPEDGQTNPFLHMGMHITLREQSSSDRPAGIKDVYQSLVQRSGVHEAEHLMIECLGKTLWTAQRSNTMPDEFAYLTCLRKL
jgi:hypothetical protein